MARKSFVAVAAIVVMLTLAALPGLTLDDHAAQPPVPAKALSTEYTGALAVTVSDDTGRRIEGAFVRIAGNASSWITNQTGQTLITGLLTDTNYSVVYTVWAEKTGYLQSSNILASVTPHNTTNVSLVVRGGTISGYVWDGTTFISGATVQISALGFTNLTDNGGNYRLLGVPSGTHSVTVSAAGYVNQTKDVVLTTGGSAIVNFQLTSQTGSISGLVLHATESVPLYNVSVSVKIGDLTFSVTTDRNGTYRIPSVPAGVYTVTASLEGFNTSSVSDVVVISGVETGDVNFLLVEKVTRLYGTVVSGSYLLPGVNITVMNTNLSATSGVEGSYEILRIPAGTYTIVATKEGYNTTTVTGVTIPRGGQVRLDVVMIGQPGALVGSVIDLTTNEALVGVTITVVGAESFQRFTLTNIYGIFEFTGLPEGNYTVQFELEGYKSKEIRGVEVTVDKVARLDQVTMEPRVQGPGGFISGFDLAHSMMILALVLTIVILAIAVILRIKTFEAPDKAPAVYDQDDEEPEEHTPEKQEQGDAGQKEAQE